MEERTVYQRIAEWQQRLKESPWFLALATVLLLVDGYLHHRYGWDPDWGDTNFALSVEALYNGIFVLMAFSVSARLAKEFQSWIKRQFVELRKLLDRLEVIFDVMKLILAHIEEIRKALPMILKYIEASQEKCP